MSLDDVSDALFGARYRLRIAAAIARAEPAVVFAKQVAEDSDVAPNIVGRELKRFVRAGLLTQLNQHEGGGVKVMYERVESSLWKLVLSFATEIEAEQISPR